MSDGGYSDGYGSGYDSEVAMLGRHTGHWSYGRAEMSKKAKDTLEETKARLEHLLGNMNAPDLDEAPEFPKDAGVKARKQLKTLHNQRLRGAFVKLTDTHLVQAAQKQFKKHAEQWGVVVRKVPKHKEGRKSPIFHTYVRVLRCNQERYRRWVAARKSAEAKPAADAAAGAAGAVEVKREREEATAGRADAKRVKRET